MIETNRSKNMW